MRVVIFGQAIIRDPVSWSPDLLGLTAGADAVICNFEGCLPPDGAWPMKTKTVHPAHPDAPDMLRRLGVSHLAIANNHVWDFGQAGIVETRRRLTEKEFAVAGAGADAAEAWKPAEKNAVALIAVDAGPTPDWAVAGQGPGVAALRLDRVLGLPQGDIDRLNEISAVTGDAQRRRLRQEIGYDPETATPMPFGLRLERAPARTERFVADPREIERLCDSITDARATASLVIVSLHYHHWAADWLEPPEWFEQVAGSCSSAGADAVVGTGPPWHFPVRFRNRTLIAPGLGNLSFHTLRAAKYDELGLRVWDGLGLVFEDGDWTQSQVAVARPRSD